MTAQPHVTAIIVAARRMGIYMSMMEDNGQWRFDWYDPMTNATINGVIANDKINALELACNKLVDYLKIHATNIQPTANPNPGSA